MNKSLREELDSIADRCANDEIEAWEINFPTFRRRLNEALKVAGKSIISEDEHIQKIERFSGAAGFYDVSVEQWSGRTGLSVVEVRIFVSEVEAYDEFAMNSELK